MVWSSCSSHTADSLQQNTKLKQTILKLKEERQELFMKAAIQDKQINELDETNRVNSQTHAHTRAHTPSWNRQQVIHLFCPATNAILHKDSHGVCTDYVSITEQQMSTNNVGYRVFWHITWWCGRHGLFTWSVYGHGKTHLNAKRFQCCDCKETQSMYSWRMVAFVAM